VDRAKRIEEIRRGGAYHEAAHAVIDVALDHTVRYVSIWTPGTDYRDVCVRSVNYMPFKGVGRIPVLWEAFGYAISTFAGNMAMWRVDGEPYPWDSWQKIIKDCKEIEASGDPDLLEGDTMSIHEFCEAAARWGQMVRVPASDELIPSTGEEAFEAALRETECLVDEYWSEIRAVAEKLMEVGCLTGEQVEEIVFGSDPSEEERT
jgi:hypothetical protein